MILLQSALLNQVSSISTEIVVSVYNNWYGAISKEMAGTIFFILAYLVMLKIMAFSDWPVVDLLKNIKDWPAEGIRTCLT